MQEIMREKFPAMLEHEGIWEGTYRYIGLDGELIDQHDSRVECVFPDEGPYVYVQKNQFTWPDGRDFRVEFGGECRGDRIYWDTEDFAGYAWETDDGVILLNLDRKDDPGANFVEMIVMGAGGRHRARTWHWFKADVCFSEPCAMNLALRRNPDSLFIRLQKTQFAHRRA